MGPGPWPILVRFARLTPLRYVGKISEKFLGPPLDQSWIRYCLEYLPPASEGWRKVMFSLCPPFGGGTPSQVWVGGTLARSGWWGDTPSQVWVGGTQPGLDGGGYPGQVWMVGVPQPGLDGGGYPGYPPPPIRQSSIVSTCYAAGGMPLAFTQEDFLVVFSPATFESDQIVCPGSVLNKSGWFQGFRTFITMYSGHMCKSTNLSFLHDIFTDFNQK